MKDVIFNEDCFETMKRMPDNYVDCIITSPPYNKRNIGGGIFGPIVYDSVSDDWPEEEYQENQIKFLNECYRVGKVMFYNHKVRYASGNIIHPISFILKSKWKVHQEIIWNRKTTCNVRGWRCWNIDERIYWLVKEVPEELPQNLAQYTSIWEINPERDSEHPAPFPIEIPDRCIKLGSKEGGIIYDSYMGSGTTLVASIINKRHYIGSEISKNYYNMAVERINKDYKNYKNLMDFIGSD